MVFVVSNTGERLMPTSEYRARKLLKSGRAVIHRRKPFAIRILDRSSGEVQPVEYTTDVGYLHVGVTVKSEKHSFFEMQADLLKDEKEHHNDRKSTGAPAGTGKGTGNRGLITAAGKRAGLPRPSGIR